MSIDSALVRDTVIVLLSLLFLVGFLHFVFSRFDTWEEEELRREQED